MLTNTNILQNFMKIPDDLLMSHFNVKSENIGYNVLSGDTYIVLPIELSGYTKKNYVNITFTASNAYIRLCVYPDVYTTKTKYEELTEVLLGTVERPNDASLLTYVLKAKHELIHITELLRNLYVETMDAPTAFNTH